MAALLAVGLAPSAFLHFRERPPAPAAPVRLQIPLPENATIFFTLSPDGRKLAFSAGERLLVYFLESGESHDLTDTGGTPFWSPDSRFIGYSSQGKLKKIEATGGPTQTVAGITGAWGMGSWNQDDVIVFGERQVGLFRVPASGGIPVRITALDPARHENSHYSPSFLPDGRHFVYLRASTDQEKSAIYLGSVDAKPEQQSSKPLVYSNWGPRYAASADPRIGYLLFMREGTLMAQPFDNRRLELKGQATPVADRVDDSGGGGHGAFSASTNDVLALQRRAASDRQLTWYDREGKVRGTVAEAAGLYEDLALSPDGTRLAVSIARGTDATSIWLLDLSRGGARTRFTFGSGSDSSPVWSPEAASSLAPRGTARTTCIKSRRMARKTRKFCSSPARISMPRAGRAMDVSCFMT
jgi:dipeptidyl aminopeptidase/acylaminoacyl peptidase